MYRKIILVSKAAIAVGVALLLFMLLGLFGSFQVGCNQIGFRGARRNGVVLGSNIGTLQQTMAAMSAAERTFAWMLDKQDGPSSGC